jgi:hypothetical protein
MDSKVYSKNYNKKGEIAILVLWAFLLLVFFGIGFAKRASYETKMVSYSWDRAQAFYLTWDGLESIMKLLKEDDLNVDSYLDKWARGGIKGKTKEGEWRADILYDEERYIDINKAGPVILRRIFPHPQYDVLYDSLLDWLDPDSTPHPLGAEAGDTYYVQQGYEPRNGPMKSLFELYMIKGGTSIMPSKPTAFIPENDFSFIKKAYAHSGSHFTPPPDPGPDPFPIPWPRPPFPGAPPPGPPDQPPQGPPIPIRQPTPTGTGITVYGDGRTNINTAWDPVLGALGFLPETVKRILWYRLGGHVFKQATADYIVKQLLKTGWLKTGEPLYTQIALNIKNVANTGKLKINSSYFRIRIVSTTKRGGTHTAELVLERIKSFDGVKFKIISWWEKYYL